jgi:hypothetical protein
MEQLPLVQIANEMPRVMELVVTIGKALQPVMTAVNSLQQPSKP